MEHRFWGPSFQCLERGGGSLRGPPDLGVPWGAGSWESWKSVLLLQKHLPKFVWKDSVPPVYQGPEMERLTLSFGEP